MSKRRSHAQARSLRERLSATTLLWVFLQVVASVGCTSSSPGGEDGSRSFDHGTSRGDTHHVDLGVSPVDRSAIDDAAHDLASTDKSVDAEDLERVDLPQPTDLTSDRGGISCAPGQRVCASAMHHAICNATGHGWTATPTACPAGSHCDDGACIGDIAWHLRQAVSLQWVEGENAKQLSSCASSASVDISHGRLLCDVWHAIKELKPRFGLFFGNSWMAFSPSSADACMKLPPAKGLPCLAQRLHTIARHFHLVAPHLLLAAHLAEYIYKGNVIPTQWPSICKQGTVGHWGKDTCIPDLVGSQAARDYFVSWGKTFIDAGIRAFVFGQARLVAGGGGSSGSAVSPKGALAIKEIVDALQAYARTQGIPSIYFGTQNASSVKAGGIERIQFVTGAQHLEPYKSWLLQPLRQKGHPLYGPGDVHDANIINNSSELPVLLDYDNSGDPNHPDDIRRLGMLANNAMRARVFKDHFRHLHLYNPNANLAVPVSNVLATHQGITCHGVNSWHFSGNACGIIPAAKELFASPTIDPCAPGGSSNPPIRRAYWAKELRGRDETISWLYRALLDRPVHRAAYAAWIKGIPDTPINTGAGSRLTLAKTIITSQEFTARALSNTDFVKTLYRAILLRIPSSSEVNGWATALQTHARTRQQELEAFCTSPEATSLYQ